MNDPSIPLLRIYLRTMKARLHKNLQTNAPKNKILDKCKNLHTNILALQQPKCGNDPNMHQLMTG